jgi:phosphatidylethanolamine/phosphatidyl-N-methylethanolamine N-methyltransferase
MNRNSSTGGGQTGVRENEVFFRQWLRSPKSMGSVLPSSKSLARAIAAEVAWRPGQAVVELGGGTGAISKGLLEAGIPPQDLVIVELDRPLFTYLRERFPQVRVIHGDATRLGRILEELNVREVGTVISGLPMIAMPLDFQRTIMEESFRALQPGGYVLQYTFSPLVPIPADRLDIDAKRVKVVVRNLPPASIWRFRPRAGARRAGNGNGAAGWNRNGRNGNGSARM